jgi:hypothetical protein
MLQSFAFEEFHGDEGAALVFANIVNGADIRMIQGGSGFGFATEALESVFVVGEIVGKKFQGDGATEARIFRFVNHTHTTATKHFENAIVGDGLARNWAGVRHSKES